MLVEIGRLSFGDGPKNIYICNEKKIEKSAKDRVILTERDMDCRWIERICNSAKEDIDGNYRADGIESKYLLLYVIFSTRMRFYYEDIISIGEQSNFFRTKDLGFDAQSYYWSSLLDFMLSNGFEYKIFKGNRNLYNGKIKVEYAYYTWKEWISLAGIKLFVGRLHSFMIQRGVRLGATLGKKFRRGKIAHQLEKEYSKSISLNPQSQSGCLFFQSMNHRGEQFFIKYGTGFFSDIKDEYKSAKRVFEKSNDITKYLLPLFPESQENKLVFDFEQSQVTLKQVLEKKALSEKEFELLVDYLVDVLTDLKDCHVVHRDIHTSNILVQFNSENVISGYKLIDFGCACVDEKVKNNSIIDLRKNKYAGSMYRFSAYAWNDAASALFLLLQISNIDFKKFQSKLDLIVKLFEKNYTIYNA